MSTSNNALRVAELDFFSIKENIKNFLRSQNTLTDYDYEGSGMSVLLDILAYNTYYNSFYLNMAANEAFLDTAQVRQNILSHAKTINYVPASSQGSEAVINVRITPNINENQNTNSFTVDKYSRLLGRDINGVNYPFVTINANTSYKSNGSFYFSNVRIKQGEVVTLQYPAFANNTSRRYQIPSANVDTTSLAVTVQQSSSNTYTEIYTRSDDITEADANSTVFFIEEDDKLYYTLYFGDGVIGKRPSDGNIINITYLDTAGSVSNNISKFVFTDPNVGQFSNVVISTRLSSAGGADKEKIEDIRLRAPGFYTSQNRAVTSNDYETLVLKDYSNIDAVSIWGGEDHVPVTYGKVFMSIKTKGYYALSNLEKEKIKQDLIRRRNVLTVIPEIIDPDYTFLLIRGQIRYNPSKTTKTADQLLNIVKDAVAKYNTDELNSFKSVFRKSKLQRYIEDSDGAITSSDLDILIQKRVDIAINSPKSYVVDFFTPLQKGNFKFKFNTFPSIRVLDSFQFYSNELFVTTLYNTLLGRPPEQAGFDFWINELNKGVSRTNIINEFVNSSEFRNDEIFVTNLYLNILKREPDTEGLNFWTNQLRSGATRLNVIDSFLNSPEFNSGSSTLSFINYIPGLSLTFKDILFEEAPESRTGIDSIEVIENGVNYSSIPTISIVGDGKGAAAEARIVGGRVESIRVTNPGRDYTQATVYIIGGDGTGAAAVAKLQSKRTRIRSFFYRDGTGEKVEFNPNIGTIDYDTGRITLSTSSLTVTSVQQNSFYDTNVLSINAVSEEDIIYPLRNRIMSIDTNNGQSIMLEMIAET